MNNSLEERVDSMVRVTSDVRERLRAVEEAQESDQHRLWGNGQPGEIKNLNDKVEKLKWWIIGSAIMGLLGHAGGDALIKYLIP